MHFFTTIFKKSLDAADIEGKKIDKADKHGRKAFFIRKFTKNLYKNVCRSLFAKDKLLFSFLMCLKIMDENKELEAKEERFLMTGATSIEMSRPNPTGNSGWLSDKQWASILQLSNEIEAFKGFDTDFELLLNDWERVYNSQIPHKGKEVWPGVWNELNLFRRLVVLRILRPDKVIPAIQRLIKKEKELQEEEVKQLIEQGVQANLE